MSHSIYDLISVINSSSTIPTRASFDLCLLGVPPVNKVCANSSFKRSLMVVAFTLWNNYDLDIRWLTFDSFHNKKIIDDETLSETLCRLIMC